MHCPFCHTEIISDDPHCPMCHQEISFSVRIIKAANILHQAGNQALKHHTYKRAAAFYQSFLKYSDKTEVWSQLQRIEKRRSYLKITGIAVFTLGIFSMVALLVPLLEKKRDLPNSSPNGTVILRTDYSKIHAVRRTYDKQQWEKSWDYLKKLNQNADWRWAIEGRSSEIQSKYIHSKLEEARYAKERGDNQNYQSILAFLARNGLDTSDQTVFRLRRAEGRTLFLRAEQLDGIKKERLLKKIIGLFTETEYRHIYYLDDSLYQLGKIEEKDGRPQEAAGYYRLLIEKCPQGQWYWPQANARLSNLTSDRP